ncbi:MAG: cyclic nucleotide-binding domain-containing protein [Nitrospirota bacterium]
MKEEELGRTYPDGDTIFEEGQEGDRMFVIQSGRVKITKKSPGGEMTVAVLNSGDIFGEMALFDKLPRSATASALGEARVLTIDKEKLFQAISRDPTLAFRIVSSMSQRIRRLDDELIKMKKKRLTICISLDETCEYILEEARNAVSAENGSIMLLDEDEKVLSVRAAFGNEWNPKLKLNIGEGVAGDVLMTGKAELINSVSHDARFKSGNAEISSLLCVPLRWKGPIGVINLSNSSQRVFTLDDLKMLRSLAMYASIAIENAKTCAFLKRTTEEVLLHVSLLDMS